MFNIYGNLYESLALRHSCLGVYIPKYQKQMNKEGSVPVI